MKDESKQLLKQTLKQIVVWEGIRDAQMTDRPMSAAAAARVVEALKRYAEIAAREVIVRQGRAAEEELRQLSTAE